MIIQEKNANLKDISGKRFFIFIHIKLPVLLYYVVFVLLQMK